MLSDGIREYIFGGGIWESPGIPPVWLIERECVEGKVRVCSHGWCDLGPAPGDQRCER